MKSLFVLVLFLVLPLLGGQISAAISGNIGGIYALLNQPPYSPPAPVFPVVWSILYLLMGSGSWLVYRAALAAKKSPAYYLFPYGIQLAINFAWSPVYFGAGGFMAGAWLAVALLVAVFWMILRFAKISLPAARMQIPYLLWCGFAVYLSFGVALLNRGN